MPEPLGLFVGYAPYLADSPGGVQACTRDYLALIRGCGVEVVTVPFLGDRRLSTRLRRQFNSSPYFRPYEPSLVARLHDAIRRHDPSFVFLNQVAIGGLAQQIRPWLRPDCRIVVLSHGMEATDLFHLFRLRERLPLSGRLRPSAASLLGSVLIDEAAARRDVDLVCTLSPVDAALERWIGTARAEWLPRPINETSLAWRPTAGRFGYVGTLDHGPNLEGLVEVLEVFAQGSDDFVRLRVVGGPAKLGRWLERRYRHVEYLGPLDEPSLAQEAATWNAFLHPIFCQARGCSTKLAKAIGWRLPIVTTPQGRRGYTWSDGALVEAADPAAFVAACRELLDPRRSASAQRDIARVAASSPSRAELTGHLAALLHGEPAEERLGQTSPSHRWRAV